MEVTLNGHHIRSAVPHVVEVCSRERGLALPLLLQMAAKTAAYMDQALNHRNVAPYHAQVGVNLHSVIRYSQVDHTPLITCFDVLINQISYIHENVCAPHTCSFSPGNFSSILEGTCNFLITVLVGTVFSEIYLSQLLFTNDCQL